MAKKTGKRINAKRVIITLVAVYVVCHLVYGGVSIVQLKMQQKQLIQEQSIAEAEQVKLQAELEYMDSEDALEKIAREKLGLIKDGEILIRRVDTEQP